jgi:hypothetical protein
MLSVQLKQQRPTEIMSIQKVQKGRHPKKGMIYNIYRYLGDSEVPNLKKQKQTETKI